jgi:hypothetical protein
MTRKRAALVVVPSHAQASHDQRLVRVSRDEIGPSRLESEGTCPVPYRPV